MAIYKNGELSAIKNTQMEGGDILLNKTIEDYIVTASKAVTLLEAIADITNTYGIDNDSKAAVIKKITAEYERKE